MVVFGVGLSITPVPHGFTNRRPKF